MIEKAGFDLRQHPLSEGQNLTINVTQRRHPLAAGRPGGNRERRGALPPPFPPTRVVYDPTVESHNINGSSAHSAAKQADWNLPVSCLSWEHRTAVSFCTHLLNSTMPGCQ